MASMDLCRCISSNYDLAELIALATAAAPPVNVREQLIQQKWVLAVKYHLS